MISVARRCPCRYRILRSASVWNQFHDCVCAEGSQRFPFGAGGIIGALLAVGAAIGGTFLPRLLESKTSAEKLRKELEELGNVMSIDLAEDTFKLTERFRSLATHSEELAKIQLGINLVKANKAATAAISATEEATAEFITRQYTADQLLKGAE